MVMGCDGMFEYQYYVDYMLGLENIFLMMIGEGFFGLIEMGGMFIVFKVCDDIMNYEDLGWYEYLEGIVVYKLKDGKG